MKYTVGMQFRYVPDSKHEKPEITEVTRLRKHGCAALSNGLIADEQGMVIGTGRTPGGKIEEI